jgi:pimeloyl-ACP methyl ester carboxylesterase
MPEAIATGEGRFTADAAGPEGGPLVLLLHGFPQTRHSWREQVPALGAAGYRPIAPDQRGYSPGVRPDPAKNLSAYGIDRLVQDVLDLAEAADRGAPARFHLVGHDWGGQVAWLTAARHPDRIASLSVLSRPHPAAFRRAFQEDADGQRHRSRHHRAFRDPATVSLLLDNGAERLRLSLAERGVPSPAVAEYLSVLGEPAALEAAIAWYRAVGALANVEVGRVAVPTLYIWGRRGSLGRAERGPVDGRLRDGPFLLRGGPRGRTLHHRRGPGSRDDTTPRAPRGARLSRRAPGADVSSPDDRRVAVHLVRGHRHRDVHAVGDLFDVEARVAGILSLVSAAVHPSRLLRLSAFSWPRGTPGSTTAP